MRTCLIEPRGDVKIPKIFSDSRKDLEHFHNVFLLQACAARLRPNDHMEPTCHTKYGMLCIKTCESLFHGFLKDTDRGWYFVVIAAFLERYQYHP